MDVDVVRIIAAKLTFEAALLTRSGTQYCQSFPNTQEGFTQLGSWLQQRQAAQAWLCMEAANIYWEQLAIWGHMHGHIVSVVKPARINGYAQARTPRNKTGKLDRR